LRPQIEAALFRKGTALVNLQRNEEAVGVYDQALQHRAGLEPAWRAKLAKEMAYPKRSCDAYAANANPSNASLRGL
jgi:hypothetical protein